MAGGSRDGETSMLRYLTGAGASMGAVVFSNPVEVGCVERKAEKFTAIAGAQDSHAAPGRAPGIRYIFKAVSKSLLSLLHDCA